MALLIMAVHDTEENGRSRLTETTLSGLVNTMNLDKNRMIIVDNGSCKYTKELIRSFTTTFENVSVVTLPENLGTARAVNQGLKLRKPGEYCVKMDNDVLVYQRNWLDQMQEAMERMPTLGILGLKRRDLQESPHSVNTDCRSRLMEVPHAPGQRWYVVEECKHVMGTCTMLSPALLDKIGYFGQPGLYGFDDSLLCVRSQVAGFYNAFLHGIDIDHIDPGGTEYAAWKQRHAGEMLLKYAALEAEYRSGAKSVYVPAD